MITASVKTTKTKIMGTACIILAGIIALILFFGNESGLNAAESVSRHVSDNGTRIEYMAQKGLKTAEEPSAVEDILLPEEMDEVLKAYNEIQKKSGFDISPYLGKTVKKYVYPVLEVEETFVTLYVFEEKIIAADVSSHLEGWQRPIDGGENIG